MSKKTNFHIGGCDKEHRNFKVGAPLFHGQCVMLSPSDDSCIIPWDGITEECRIGYVRCVSAVEGCEDLYVQAGDCVDVRIEIPLGGRDVGCNIQGWFCDESVPPQRVWYVKDTKGRESFTKSPNSEDQVTIVGCLQPYDPSKDEAPEPKELIISTAKINLVKGVVTDLSPIPPDAIGAEIKLYGNPCCSWKYSFDGGDIADGIEASVGCDDRIAIGCVEESNSDPIELQNFKVISEDDCEESCISVTFYKQS